jgi:hypothetical protein
LRAIVGERVCATLKQRGRSPDSARPPGEAGWRVVSAVATCLSQTVGEKAKTGIDVSKCMRLEKYNFRPETRNEARTGFKPRVYAIGLFP